jgi:hypothetical protein
MEGEEIFGSSKWKAHLLLRSEGDSHIHDRVNYSHSHVNTHIGKSHVQIKWLLSNDDPYGYVWIIDGSVEVLEVQCKNGVHITYNDDPLHYTFNVQHCEKTTNHSYVTRIIIKLTTIGVLAPIYLSLWSQFLGEPFNVHKFWIYANDTNHYMGGFKV